MPDQDFDKKDIGKNGRIWPLKFSIIAEAAVSENCCRMLEVNLLAGRALANGV
jgi:hypothetical protein